jgi:hypothetical protein
MHASAPPPMGSTSGRSLPTAASLTPPLAALVPATALGRMLNPEETYKLIERFDRGLPKRRQLSVRRRAAPGREQA